MSNTVIQGNQTSNVSLQDTRTFPRPDQSAEYVTEDLLFIVFIIIAISPDKATEYRERKCTGTLIRSDMVLTAASALVGDHDEVVEAHDVFIYEMKEYKSYHALKVSIHPNYISDYPELSLTYDFALIIVETIKTVTTFPNILSDVITNYNQSLFDHDCYVAGFGTLSRNLKLKRFYIKRSNTKYLGNIVDVDDDDYKSESDVIGLRIIYHFERAIPCGGDLGAPIICQDTLYAIYVSNLHGALDCVDVYATAFSPVTNVKLWLENMQEWPESQIEWAKHPHNKLILCCLVFFTMGGIYFCLIQVLQRLLDPMDSTQDEESHDGGNVHPEDDEDRFFFGKFGNKFSFVRKQTTKATNK